MYLLFSCCPFLHNEDRVRRLRTRLVVLCYICKLLLKDANEGMGQSTNDNLENFNDKLDST